MPILELEKEPFDMRHESSTYGASASGNSSLVGVLGCKEFARGLKSSMQRGVLRVILNLMKNLVFLFLYDLCLLYLLDFEQ
ncbi:hypothetical protein ACJIZ3_008157 [Penstemon smallii]|uniref:Uncharacterized protein n=1 Tax=Penstemon smallii TaxID=265156 RepID=A0ABD3T8Y1_9LAMI